MLSKIINFIKYDIWRIRIKELNRTKYFLIKYLRVILLALRRFDENKCRLRASALTFYTLLSIVPLVAMAFGIAKGFGFESMLEQQLMEKFSGQQEVMTKVVDFAHSLLANTRGGFIAGVGVVILFWTVIKVLGNIEKSFNEIWGVKKSRSIGRKFTDYLSIMLICPILVIASSSATVFLITQISSIADKADILGPLYMVILSLLKILPYFIIWIVFSFIYIFMPNGKVNFKSGILAGILAGTIYQLVQWVYVNFQVGVSKFNAIYGSFAALPLFLIWLQISWLVVLLGAEISFAHQNVDTYEFEPDCLNISYSFKKLLTLRVANLLINDFSKCKTPLSADQISQKLELPIRLTRQILFELNASRLISEVKTQNDRESAYQPACDINQLTIKKVIDVLESRGSDNIPVAQSKELEIIVKKLSAFDDKIKNSSENILLKDI